MTDQVVITEKTSQAKDIRASVGSRYGDILPAEGHLFDLLEPKCQPVSIGAILTPPRRLDHLPDDPLQLKFEKRAIMDFEQPIGDVNSEIRVNPDQVSVERRRWIFVNGKPFETNCCPSCSYRIHDDVASSNRGWGRWEIAQRPL